MTVRRREVAGGFVHEHPGQAVAGSQRSNWLRPNELMATTKAARRPFSPRPSAPGLSNSSGPCTVKLYVGPPSCRQSMATVAGFVPWAVSGVSTFVRRSPWSRHLVGYA